MCVITYKDGTKHEMMVKTAPSIATHIVKTMKDTGYLSLWNDTDSFICDAELVRTIELRKVTK